MVKIVVTLYNKGIKDSTTLLSLLECSHELTFCDIIIWDNSLAALSLSDFKLLNAKLKIIYHHTSANLPLSKIYNYVINNYISESDYLLILDDDSIFNKSLFENFFKAISRYNFINLILPIITSNGKIISPANNFIIKTSYWNKIKTGITSTKYLTAINSGMLISGRFLKGFNYDERLMFYGTDNYFMYNFRETNKNLFIVDEVIEHKLSFFEEDNSRRLFNFRETKRSNLIIYSKNTLHLILSIINNAFVSIKYSIIYRSFKFLQ